MALTGIHPHWSVRFGCGTRFTNSLLGKWEYENERRISPRVSALALDLTHTTGYLVADVRGRIVGKVECPMYGSSPETPDALSVRSGFLARRRRLVPAETIEQIDGGSRVIGLRIDRESVRTFL